MENSLKNNEFSKCFIPSIMATICSGIFFLGFSVFSKQGVVEECPSEKQTYSSQDSILSKTKGFFIDERDGHQYKWIRIGDQVWMAENLAYLPWVSPPSSESYTESHYYVNGYNYNKVNEAKATINYEKFGVLYNWPAAMNMANSEMVNNGNSQGVCPSGWHLPGSDEWNKLEDFLGGSILAGGKMKEWDYNSIWKMPNEGASNTSGFTGLPGGYRWREGTFMEPGPITYWWSNSQISDIEAYAYGLYFNDTHLSHFYGNKDEGFSVRCIQNKKLSNGSINNQANTVSHYEIFENIEIAHKYLEDFSLVKEIDFIKENGKRKINGNLIYNLNNLNLSCFPTIKIPLDDINKEFRIRIKNQTFLIRISKASEAIDLKVFSIYCIDNTTNNEIKVLVEAQKELGFGPSETKISFSSDFNLLYFTLDEQNSGFNKLYCIDLKDYKTEEIDDPTRFYIIQDGKYKDYILSIYSQWGGDQFYSIIDHNGNKILDLGNYCTLMCPFH